MSALVEQAFAIAFEQLGGGAGGGPMLPFVLVAGHDGRIDCMTIVTGRSDKAAYLGRRLVRGRAAEAQAYAIVTDTYIRRGSDRLDAIVVECAARGEPSATMVARAYDHTETTLDLGKRPSELEPWDPFTLDWGSVTPDIYVAARKLGVHVVNHSLESEENVRRTVRFLRARIQHHARHLPLESRQLVNVDERGQNAVAEARALLAELEDQAQLEFITDLGK